MRVMLSPEEAKHCHKPHCLARTTYDLSETVGTSPCRKLLKSRNISCALYSGVDISTFFKMTTQSLTSTRDRDSGNYLGKTMGEYTKAFSQLHTLKDKSGIEVSSGIASRLAAGRIPLKPMSNQEQERTERRPKLTCHPHALKLQVRFRGADPDKPSETTHEIISRKICLRG